MTDKLEVYVTLNDEQRLYAVDHGEFVTTLGYDVVASRTERMLTELVGRLKADEKWLDEQPDVTPGTREAWDLYIIVQQKVKEACEEQGERAVYDLSPQLMGLEGWRVQVVDNEGDEPRRFIVGRSTGWAPCHLEIRTSRSRGGDPARLTYHRVTTLGRVR